MLVMQMIWLVHIGCILHQGYMISSERQRHMYTLTCPPIICISDLEKGRLAIMIFVGHLN
jgi:hypothetical protein